MFELVLTVCSVLQGASCRELPPIRLGENTLLTGCVIASQIEGARWVSEHPNYWIQRSTCQPAGRFART